MTDVPRSVPDIPDIIDDFTKWFERRDSADARLRQARDNQPLAWALVMAALSWNKVDHRGWRTPAVLCAQARRLMGVWGVHTESVDDADRVSAALAWAMRKPALMECDDQGRYRPVYGAGFAVGSQVWREHHDAAVVSGVLTPLELVSKGDADHYGNPADLDAAEVSYRLAVDSDDPDAAALASLRLAQLAESRDQPAEAARRYADVAALEHPVASPPAVLWLARQAAQDGDRPAARVLANQVVESGDESLLSDAWGLLGHLAWLDEDRDGAVAAMRLAVDTAGVWHRSFSQLLAEMLVACGDLSGAADAYRRLLDQPLLPGDPTVGRYVQLMAAAERLDEAVAVLEQCAADEGLFVGDLLLALASVHAARDDLDALRQVMARVRAHWSAILPHVSVRADVIEASVAIVDGDDERAAQLYRSLTDTDDTERRDLARPLLITAGEQFAVDKKLCMIPGTRPLLEYLSEAAAPETAAWAAISLAHLATVEGRPDDAKAAFRLAARHLSPDEVALERERLRLQRARRARRPRRSR
ncbi:MAG: tetratricopeptide repeat protein [Pseudonocardiaceae bacterium]